MYSKMRVILDTRQWTLPHHAVAASRLVRNFDHHTCPDYISNGPANWKQPLGVPPRAESPSHRLMFYADYCILYLTTLDFHLHEIGLKCDAISEHRLRLRSIEDLPLGTKPWPLHNQDLDLAVDIVRKFHEEIPALLQGLRCLISRRLEHYSRNLPSRWNRPKGDDSS